jgi:hypothetical protein
MITHACLELRRAGIRAEHPHLSRAEVEKRLWAELDARRNARDRGHR